MDFEPPQAQDRTGSLEGVEIDGTKIKAFLAISRRYFNLASPHSDRLVALDFFPAPKGAETYSFSLKMVRKMTRYRTFISSALLVSAFGLVAAMPASANQDCGPSMGQGEWSKHRAERMEEHHKKLHDALKLGADQEGAWNQLMALEHPMAKAEAPKREDWAKLTPPEREEKILERMKAHQVHMADHLAALKTFYAALTSEQKKVFDDFHAAPGAGMHGKPGPRSPGADAMPHKH